MRHHFDGGSLARSYLELARRGHVTGRYIDAIVAEYALMIQERRVAGASELGEMAHELELNAPELPPPVSRPRPSLDYLELVRRHNPRRRKKR